MYFILKAIVTFGAILFVATGSYVFYNLITDYQYFDGWVIALLSFAGLLMLTSGLAALLDIYTHLFDKSEPQPKRRPTFRRYV